MRNHFADDDVLVQQRKDLVDVEADILHVERVDTLLLLFEEVVDLEVHLENRLLSSFAVGGQKKGASSARGIKRQRKSTY